MLAVDENCGGASDTDPASLPDIAVDKGGDLRITALFSEPIHVQTQILCKLLEQFTVKFVVIFKHLIVVLPELPLLAGGKGSLGSGHRQLVVPQGEVFENQFNLFGIFLKHLLEYGDKPRAVRSLEVIESGDSHLGVG